MTTGIKFSYRLYEKTTVDRESSSVVTEALCFHMSDETQVIEFRFKNTDAEGVETMKSYPVDIGVMLDFMRQVGGVINTRVQQAQAQG